MRFPYVSSEGAELCALTTEHFWSGVHGIEQHIDKSLSEEVEPEVWLGLFRKAVACLAKSDAHMLLFRLTISPEARCLSERLAETGFEKKHERIEYRAPVAGLPGDEGSPLHWLNMQEADWSSEKIAAFLERVAAGDPDYDSGESALGLLEDWLKDPVLTRGPSCVEVGFLGKEPVALVVAQINPRTKWSRISYMGLLPEFRGRGFGQWVHRRGFRMMRSQGGDLYHGGTHAENNVMQRLFARHGCKEYRKMEEWVYSFAKGAKQ